MVPRPQSSALAHVRALLGVVSTMRSGRLDAVLSAVAEAIAGPMAFATVAVNLRRPGHDELEVVLVHGDPAARAALLGRATSLEDWQALLDPRFDHGGAFFLPAEARAWEQERVPSYVRDRAGDPAPGRWHPQDALLLPLRSSAGDLLGVVSVDEPGSGRRPGDDELDLLVAIAAHAAVAIEQTARAADAERERAALSDLVRVSARLGFREGADDLLRAACEGVAAALGAPRVAVLLRDADDVLRPRVAAAPADADPLELPPVALAEVPGLLEPALETAGCLPARRDAALGRVPAAWVLVPLRDAEGLALGALWLDEPAGAAPPAAATLAALRAIADQVAGALAPGDGREGLREVPDAA